MICAAIILINLTSEPWNEKDSKVIERAKIVCSADARHNGFPCVKSVTKCLDQHYNVICGRKK